MQTTLTLLEAAMTIAARETFETMHRIRERLLEIGILDDRLAGELETLAQVAAALATMAKDAHTPAQAEATIVPWVPPTVPSEVN
jgi:glycerate-2-kinase